MLVNEFHDRTVPNLWVQTSSLQQIICLLGTAPPKPNTGKEGTVLSLRNTALPSASRVTTEHETEIAIGFSEIGPEAFSVLRRRELVRKK